MQIRRPRGAPRERTRPGTVCLCLFLALVLLLGAVPWPFAAGATASAAAAPVRLAGASARKLHDAQCHCRLCRGGRACCCLPKPGDAAPAANPFALRAVCDEDTPATLLASPAGQPALPPLARAAAFAPALFDVPARYLVPANGRAVWRAAVPVTPPPQSFLA